MDLATAVMVMDMEATVDMVMVAMDMVGMVATTHQKKKRRTCKKTSNLRVMAMAGMVALAMEAMGMGDMDAPTHQTRTRKT